jgi:hypothetical protein
MEQATQFRLAPCIGGELGVLGVSGAGLLTSSRFTRNTDKHGKITGNR